MKVLPVEGELEDVVKKVVAEFIADKGDGHISSQLVAVDLGPPDPENFVPFSGLTEGIVVGWIEALLGATSIDMWKANLDQRLYEMCDLQELALPW